MEAIMKGCLDQANIAIVKWLVGAGASIRLEDIGDAAEVGAWRIEADADGTHVDVYSVSEGSGIIVDGRFAESAGEAIPMLVEAVGLRRDESGLSGGLLSKAVPATARFLSHRGYEILDGSFEAPDGSCYVVALNDGDIVFARVVAGMGCSFGMLYDNDEDLRESFELAAATYLANERDLVDMPVRLDVVSLFIIGDDRAFVKHRINVTA